MAYFQYNGQSTETIISTPLILVNIDSSIEMTSTRNKLEGERTISRNVTNEYGTISEPLSFSYGLMKSDFLPFTVEEQVKIERWLTSPKLSSELKIRDCGTVAERTTTINNVSETIEEIVYEDIYYFGLFTSVSWGRGNGGIYYATFTFQVNGSYPYKYVSQRIWPPTNNPSASNGDVTINCISDELEEYVYPTFEIKARTFSDTSSVKIIQRTDNYNQLNLTTQERDKVTIDCQHCMVYSQAHALRFRDIGWRDVDNVYWPRLIPGTNILGIEGNVTIDMSYYAPYKRVGGWLI